MQIDQTIMSAFPRRINGDPGDVRELLDRIRIVLAPLPGCVRRGAAFRGWSLRDNPRLMAFTPPA